ncbi:MAG: beta galactosidase jelly roll domain-containing protein [Ignavibacteriae bacterium]|nr:beta galactosidase jelly roll domain-containing protein [Ignavibacteriota bacterium]
MHRKHNQHTRLALSILLLISVSSLAQVRLPRLVSDGMVLQRNADVKIWGWASHGEKVSVRFVDSTYSTITDSSGSWSVTLAQLQPGGPHDMQIRASDSVTIHDILIGDVWVCSGQSNMELPMKRVRPLYENEIAAANNSQIRQFAVPQQYDFNKPHDDLTAGSWKSVTPENVLDFSAVAYFFAKEVYERHKIPIGLIHSSLGGSPAQSWMSEEALKAFPTYYEEAQRFKDSTLIQQIETSDRTRINAWYTLLRQKDKGYSNPRQEWLATKVKTSGWSTMNVPGYWYETKIGDVNGVVWFRKTITLPASAAGKQAKLILGRIVDADSVFVNGVFIGTTSYQYPPRRYEIPPKVLKRGQNTIVVRVINSSGHGGFVPDKPYELIVDDVKIDLKGKWQCRLGATMTPLASQTFIRWKPLGLYNAMLAPLFNYRIKGVIWYQGESNTRRPVEYRELFPAMIRNWRSDWKQGEFPFLFVQLTNFMESKSQPSESEWALLRESQLRTLSLPNTAMAVTIDIGEWNDIHPLNKKDVGKRLALAAEKVAYGNGAIVSSGPLYQSMRTDSNKIVVKFSEIGSGLTTKDGAELKQFAIAGADKKFVWAHARIEGDEVIVWNESVATPVAVRYAWADNPEGANLCNKEGLPASPFRTDEW